jgi:hypothetical protein
MAFFEWVRGLFSIVSVASPFSSEAAKRRRRFVLPKLLQIWVAHNSPIETKPEKRGNASREKMNDMQRLLESSTAIPTVRQAKYQSL